MAGDLEKLNSVLFTTRKCVESGEQFTSQVQHDLTRYFVMNRSLVLQAKLGKQIIKTMMSISKLNFLFI